MRDYINRNIRIDGRLIPYPVYTSWEYFELHDGIEDVEDFVDSNPAYEIFHPYIIKIIIIFFFELFNKFKF